VNVGTRYTLGKHYELFAQVNNALNRHYSTGGQLASTPYDNAGNFAARPFAPLQFGGETVYPTRSSTFFAPGAPVTVFGGLKVSFGDR
jgi:outer membrane receptor protein involved in Fe transport